MRYKVTLKKHKDERHLKYEVLIEVSEVSNMSDIERLVSNGNGRIRVDRGMRGIETNLIGSIIRIPERPPIQGEWTGSSRCADRSIAIRATQRVAMYISGKSIKLYNEFEDPEPPKYTIL